MEEVIDKLKRKLIKKVEDNLNDKFIKKSLVKFRKEVRREVIDEFKKGESVEDYQIGEIFFDKLDKLQPEIIAKTNFAMNKLKDEVVQKIDSFQQSAQEFFDNDHIVLETN